MHTTNRTRRESVLPTVRLMECNLAGRGGFPQKIVLTRAAPTTAIPTPTPMPALAPVDSPELLLLDPLFAAAIEGVDPGVLVVVPTSTTVVAGDVATTTEVRVVYAVVPSEVVGTTEVIVSVLVEYEMDELVVVITTGLLVVLCVVVVDVGVGEGVVVVVVVDEVVLKARK